MPFLTALYLTEPPFAAVSMDNRSNILIPLDRKQILLAAVALPARRDGVAASGFAPAYQRDYMVHRQLGGGYLLMAIMTDPPGQLALPPLRPAKLPGPFFLLPELLRRYGYYERWFLSSLHWSSIYSHRARRGRSQGLPRTRSGDLHSTPGRPRGGRLSPPF